MKMSGYNIMRDDSAILEEHENSPPSFSVRLYPDHWTLNSGPKFSYNNHVSSILEDIRAFRIPTDFIQIFDDAGVPYYNGCLIVEILDFRPARAKEPILERPDKQRVVLRPNPETIWADICILNAKNGAKWSDMDALQVESKLLLSTSTPLCLDPDPSLMRIVNSILRVSTPNVPNSLKRKAAAMVDLEEDETEKAKRAKIMQFMNPQFSPARKPLHTNYKILALLEQRRLAASAGTQQKAQPTPNTTIPTNLPSGTMVPPNINNQQAQDKTTTTVIPSLTTSYSQANSVPQSVPTPAPAPQTQVPPQVQHAIDPSHRMSPSKQQQAANNSTPQRPPSQPVVAPQTNNTTQHPQPQPPPQQQQQQQQGQVQGQQPAQSSQFTPPIPPTNFLHAPPTSRRRPSATVHPSTPAVSNAPLPAQQAASQGQTQPQPQAQTQPQVQVQAQAHQGQAQQQVAVQPTAQQQPQQVQQAAQPARPQVPTSMTSMQNMTQFYQNNRAMPMTQATAAMVAAAAAQRQQTLTNGRSTPANAGNTNSNASPVPPLPPSAMTRSPMIPPAAVAAMMSRQNTPVAAGGQVARGSPLAGNHAAAAAARAAAPLQQPQQLGQQTVPGGQPVMMQPGVATVAPNPALAYQYQIQQQRMQTYIRAQLQMQQAQQQAQMQQQGRMTPAVQQHAQQQQQQRSPQTQQSAGVRPQSAGQDHQQQQQAQFNGMQQQQQTQQAFAGMQMPYNYMNLGAQHPQHYLWQQRQMGRGMGQMGQGSGQAVMPPGMTIQQMQGLGRGGLPNR